MQITKYISKSFLARLFFIISLLLIGCKNKITNTVDNNKIKSLETLTESLKTTNDSLKRELNYWFEEDFQEEELKNKGVKEPKTQIIKAFRKRTDLIPIEGSLGGEVKYGHCQLLGTHWIISEFDDGHSQGYGLFGYTINKDTTINFKLIDWKFE